MTKDEFKRPVCYDEPAPGYCQQCKQYSIEEPLPAQRTWVGLTYDEFRQIMLATYNIDLNVPGHSSDDYLLWNAIEAKLKEKNT